MERKRAIYLFCIAILLITAIACDISFSRKDDGPSQEQIEFELTRQSLQRTQTAQADLEQEPEEPEPEPVDTSPEEEEDEEDETDNENCYYSRWTGDETIPDGTKFDPGDSFIKTWTVRNEGTCKWTTDFKIEYEDGDKLGAPTSVKLTHEVSPGETYTLEVPMTAPSSDGNYTGVWRFKAADGTKMGKYWVKITVGDPAPAGGFAVTTVNYSGYDSVVDIVCPSNEVVNITANITTNGAGQVSFKWDDSVGCPGCATKSMTFNDAGTKSVTHSMIIPAGGDYWAKIYIDEPNHQWWNPATFEAHCNP